MRPDCGTTAFMYHEITDDPSSTGFQRRGARSYACTTDGFARHLALLHAAARPPSLVTETSLIDPGEHIFLTFDDGGRSALAAAAALDRRGWRGHFFIVTGRIGQRRFLTESDLRALRRSGHLVGSHSVTHPDIFPALPTRRMREEWRISRDVLEQITGAACAVASIPGGDLAPSVAASAAASGITTLFTSEPWRRPRRCEGVWLIGRYAVRSGLEPYEYRRLIAGHGWVSALVRRRCAVVARRALGPLYRLYVRHSTAGDSALGVTP